jgi:hypothetical protein
VDSRRAWHLVALVVFACAAAIHTRPWFTEDRMPPGDFPGYAAQIQYVRDALLEHGRVPNWCVECYGGTTNFTANLKEYLAFPLAAAWGPVVATKLAFVLLRVIGALALYWLVARELAAPAVGIAAGYAYSYGAIANLQIEHLDVAVATAILPFLWIAAVSVLRHGGVAWAVALGVAMACQLANNWVHAATAPLAVLALALVRPWRGANDDAAPWRDGALARRWALRGFAAFAVFCVFAASSVAWLASDARNHHLLPEKLTEAQRGFYVERSPFLFANRDDVLAPWLALHQPPYSQGVSIADGGKRYLGGVLIAVVLTGAFAMRRDPVLRRWAALAGLAFALQYWLALGPRTLLWEVGESLHWQPASQAQIAWLLRASAALCVPAGIALAIRRAQRGRALALIAAALLLFFPTASLWNACASFIAVFSVQRSPGHFFDTAPFALSLGFAACLAALARRIERPALASAFVAVVGAALVLDYHPSTRSFHEGTPIALVNDSAALVSGLPDEGGTLRVGLSGQYSPIASWLLTQTRAGHTWGWLGWQAGRYWVDSYATAAFGSQLADPGTEKWSARYAPLLQIARVRHFLLPAQSEPPPAPWQRVVGNGRFALWEQPEVAPYASGYRAWVVWEGPAVSGEAAAAAFALRENALLVVPTGDAGTDAELRSHAARALTSPRVPSRPLLETPAPAPIDVAVQRPKPEQIRLELDAGDAPALAFVSEGHHPWWRAQVDGQTTPVLRASLAHMAVLVPPGRHAVELRLVRPPLVAAADTITAAAWVALALAVPGAWIASAAKRRAQRGEAERSPTG